MSPTKPLVRLSQTYASSASSRLLPNAVADRQATNTVAPNKTDDDKPAPPHQKFKLLPGGASIFFEIEGKKELIKGEIFRPDAGPNIDVRNYFDGRLTVYHGGYNINRQTTGAPLPARPTERALNYVPAKRLNWIQPDIVGMKMVQTEKRKGEKSILGEAANEAIARGGVVPQPLSPWAHTKPDHINFIDRLNKGLRVPGYAGANQVHTAFESTAKLFAKAHGDIKVTRTLGEPIAGNSGLISEMNLGFVLDDKKGKAYHFSHTQPYFSNAGARNGDEVAILRFIEIQKEHLEAGKAPLSDDTWRAGSKRRHPEPDLSPQSFASVRDHYNEFMKQKSAQEAAQERSLSPVTASSPDASGDETSSRLDARPRAQRRLSYER